MEGLYSNVGQLPNVAAHRTVNQSLNFVGPTGTHTQNIVLLEQNKNQIQIYEGGIWRPTTLLLKWVYVEGMVWDYKNI